jgi:hypothetical protein
MRAIKSCLAILVKTVKVSQTKTVGYGSDRYRLGHWWVAEMLLNVQSFFFNINKNLNNLLHKAIYDTLTKLFP